MELGNNARVLSIFHANEFAIDSSEDCINPGQHACTNFGTLGSAKRVRANDSTIECKPLGLLIRKIVYSLADIRWMLRRTRNTPDKSVVWSPWLNEVTARLWR